MSLKQIKKQLKGYFLLNGRTIAKKISNTDIEIYDKPVDIIDFNGEIRRFTPHKLLLRNVHASILEPSDFNKLSFNLTDILPSINFNMFKQYDRRESQIEQHKAVLEILKPKGALFGKKENILLGIENSKGIKYYICNVKEKSLVEIDTKLVSDEIGNAIVFDDKTKVVSALNDDLKNEYTSEYKKQIKKWEKI